MVQGEAALSVWRADPAAVSPVDLATAVRYAMEELSTRHPGRSVEVRVPPYAAAQCVAGATHRRGNPPAVVETDPQTWLALSVPANALRFLCSSPEGTGWRVDKSPDQQRKRTGTAKRSRALFRT